MCAGTPVKCGIRLGMSRAVFEKTSLWLSTLAVQSSDDPAAEPRERLRSAFLHFRERAEMLTAQIPRDLPEFTVHDITHLDALWETASLIAGKEFLLTPTEAFVLGGAILIHDAGMALAAYPGGLDELQKQPLWADVVASLLRARLGRLATSQPETARTTMARTARAAFARVTVRTP